ncbi:MAG: porin [Methylocystis sp.]|nr:MAG: porin [Methylocystis sp.]
MTFKASVIGAVSSILAIGAACAADLPSYKAPPPPPPAIWDWTGWHAGVSGSYGGGSMNRISDIYAFGPPLAIFNDVTTSAGTSGYLVGIQTGFNWQFPNNVVIGYESEYNYADVRTNNGGVWGNSNTRLNWYGAERLRFGYAFGRFLPYITGGLAYGKTRTSGFEAVGGLLFQNNASTWQAGWTVGAGLEYAMTNNISVKAEYLYSELKGPSGGSIGFPNAYRTFEGNGFDTHIARLGVNYQIKNFGALIGMPNLGI